MMKSAMIWGAAGGIGRALVEQLVNSNWSVIAITHRPDDLEGLTPHLIDADAAAPLQVQLAITAASQLTEAINLWIYAAGDITSARVSNMSPKTWQRILDANLTGAYTATHYSLPLLADDAHLIYLGAISERLQLPGLAAYAAAKMGLEAFVTALSKEERRRCVTLVRPAAVTTPLWEKVPMKIPNSAISPQAIAQQILNAHHHQHQGILDLA